MQHLVIPSVRSSLRLLVWLAVASMVAVLILGSTGGTALAAPDTDLHQTPPISWDDPEFQGDEEECEEADLSAGEVLWHFVLVQTDDAGGTLTATFDSAGVIVETDSRKTGKTLHWTIITGEDTLLGATTTADGKMLLLSHICSSPGTTTTTTTTTTTDTTTTTSD